MTTKIENITNIPEAFTPGSAVYKNDTDLSVLVDDYIERTIRNSIQGKEERGSLTIVDFFKLVKNVIEVRQNTEHVPHAHRILFLEDDPPEDLDTEAITYGIDIRVPGSISQGPAGSGGHREVSPRLRSMRQDPDLPGCKLLEMGRVYDQVVTFYCYARTPNVALARALWLEKLFDSFAWYFRFYNFRVIENQISRKEIFEIGNLKLIRYPVSYNVRTDDIYYINQQELRELAINMNISRT